MTPMRSKPRMAPYWMEEYPVMPAPSNPASVDPISAVSVCSELHAWECGGAQSAETLSRWVGERLAAHEAALAALLSINVPRTPENTLRLYDAALEQLSL